MIHTENIEVIIGPENRQPYLDSLLKLDGLSHIQEDPLAAYCAVSLTNTPQELKPEYLRRQDIVMEILEQAKITAYDPSSAPYSPDTNLHSQPNEVYLVDTGKIVGARFFTALNSLPSTGMGVEIEKASRFNRLGVILVDGGIRVSRMMPHRMVNLQYRDLAAQRDEIAALFDRMSQFAPGMGFRDGVAALLGFGEQGQIVDLEQLIHQEFPSLAFHYDGSAPTLELKAANPEIFAKP